MRFEYLIIRGEDVDNEEYLNDLGDVDWELVAVVITATGEQRAYFKRATR